MSIIDNRFQIVYVNSRNKITGDNSNFVFDMKIDKSVIYDHICVLDISIPKSYYLVQNNYNTFTLTEDTDTVDIVITAGNYNRNSFRNVLQDTLNSSSPNGWVYTITNMTLNTTGDNGKYTFTVSGNTSQPEFTFTDSLYEQCGFDSNTTVVFVSDTLESTNVVNFTSETTLFLHCDQCVNTSGDDILQNIISSGSSDFSYITWTNTNMEMYSKSFRGSNSSSARFYLTNEDNQMIDLNGLNIVFTILLYKKRENLDKLTKLSILHSSLSK